MFKDFGRKIQRDVKKVVDARLKMSEELSQGRIKVGGVRSLGNLSIFKIFMIVCRKISIGSHIHFFTSDVFDHFNMATVLETANVFCKAACCIVFLVRSQNQSMCR